MEEIFLVALGVLGVAFSITVKLLFIVSDTER